MTDILSYEGAVRNCGYFEVLAFYTEKAWQGVWVAKVIRNDVTGWIAGYFGSCSGCDEIEARLVQVRNRTDEWEDVWNWTDEQATEWIARYGKEAFKETLPVSVDKIAEEFFEWYDEEDEKNSEVIQFMLKEERQCE